MVNEKLKFSSLYLQLGRICIPLWSVRTLDPRGPARPTRRVRDAGALLLFVRLLTLVYMRAKTVCNGQRDACHTCGSRPSVLSPLFAAATPMETGRDHCASRSRILLHHSQPPASSARSLSSFGLRQYVAPPVGNDGAHKDSLNVLCRAGLRMLTYCVVPKLPQ